MIYPISVSDFNFAADELLEWSELESRAVLGENLIQFYLLINYMLKLEVLGLQIAKLANLNFPVQSKLGGFTVPCIVLTPFYNDDESSWLRNTELHPRWAATSDLRHLRVETIPVIDV